MPAALNQTEYVQKLATSISTKVQLELRRHIPRDDAYYRRILGIYLENPFFRLTDEEVEGFFNKQSVGSLRDLIAARVAASRSTTPKYSVFCMPKSGSSFVQSALQSALDLPFVSVTSFTTPARSSFFGMNAREQEFDELAITKSILASPDGFVSQNHTRYSMYLALQTSYFGITPILTIRNILDCIVSFDEMMVAWRTGKDEWGWLADAQFSLPLNYADLDADDRYAVLAQSFGVWLIGFFLSWKRGARQNLIRPLRLTYEEDILDAARLVERLSEHLAMTAAQTNRLRAYVANPDRRRSRFNVGARGRGRRLIPGTIRDVLVDYASRFREEISADDIEYLFG